VNRAQKARRPTSSRLITMRPCRRGTCGSPRVGVCLGARRLGPGGVPSPRAAWPSGVEGRAVHLSRAGGCCCATPPPPCFRSLRRGSHTLSRAPCFSLMQPIASNYGHARASLVLGPSRNERFRRCLAALVDPRRSSSVGGSRAWEYATKAPGSGRAGCPPADHSCLAGGMWIAAGSLRASWLWPVKPGRHGPAGRGS